MKIGIDARLIEETGVGRYIRNLIHFLGIQDKENHYIVFLRKKSFDTFALPNNRWQKRLADVKWHTVTEQFVMPWLLVKEHLDLVHVPYFNIPIFYPGKLVVTIHDLTILHVDTGKATTLPLPFYKLRRLGYYLVLSVGLIRAAHIIAVSQTTKKEIMDHFHISPDKITVTYEGIERAKSEGKRLVKDPYFLYVGNVYPHKNAETLISAFRRMNGNVKLVFVGKEDYFYKRLKKTVADLSDRVIFFGQASDGELADLYHHAIALVFPSLMEGFGLPALEALANGCPVICSDIPVFHEIVGEYAMYFNPNNTEDLHQKLEQVFKTRPNQKNMRPLLQRFNWATMAQETLRVYKDAIGSSI